MRTCGWIAVVVISIAVAAPGAAQSPASVERDAQCLTMLAAAYEEKEDASILGGVLYYLGKIDGRAPSYDYENGLKTAAIQLAGRDLEALARDCGQELEQRGKMLEAIGKKLIAEG